MPENQDNEQYIPSGKIHAGVMLHQQFGTDHWAAHTNKFSFPEAGQSGVCVILFDTFFKDAPRSAPGARTLKKLYGVKTWRAANVQHQGEDAVNCGHFSLAYLWALFQPIPLERILRLQFDADSLGRWVCDLLEGPIGRSPRPPPILVDDLSSNDRVYANGTMMYQVPRQSKKSQKKASLQVQPPKKKQARRGKEAEDQSEDEEEGGFPKWDDAKFLRAQAQLEERLLRAQAREGRAEASSLPVSAYQSGEGSSSSLPSSSSSSSSTVASGSAPQDEGSRTPPPPRTHTSG
jgi:hypothetical protein